MANAIRRTPFQRKPHSDGRGNSSLAPPKAPLRPRSKRKMPPTPQQVRSRRDEAEHQAMSRQVRHEHPVCQAAVHRRLCVGRSTDGHHVLSRARGGPNERWNYLALCHPCHMWVHDNPKFAEVAGWLAKIGGSCAVPMGSRAA